MHSFVHEVPQTPSGTYLLIDYSTCVFWDPIMLLHPVPSWRQLQESSPDLHRTPDLWTILHVLLLLITFSSPLTYFVLDSSLVCSHLYPPPLSVSTWLSLHLYPSPFYTQLYPTPDCSCCTLYWTITSYCNLYWMITSYCNLYWTITSYYTLYWMITSYCTLYWTIISFRLSPVPDLLYLYLGYSSLDFGTLLYTPPCSHT